MSISSAMNELVAVNPALTRRQLLRSGMNIGRDMVGTMTNTLILALVGSSLVLMIYLSSLEPSFSQLMTHADNPLLTAKNCYITPHIAWASTEARERLMNIAISNLQAYISGTPENVVNK